MQNLIIASITFLFGAAFLSWGIYQVKTNKMVAKNAKNTVDDPKQVGMLFTLIGIVGFWLTFVFLSQYFSPKPSEFLELISMIIGYVVVAIIFISVLSFIIYGFKNRRIFGFKNTLKIQKYTQKYYKIINTALLVTLFSSTAIFLFGKNLPFLLSLIIFIIDTASMLTAIILMIKIELKQKDKK